MSKCPLCGEELIYTLLPAREHGTSYPELFCSECDYEIVGEKIEAYDILSDESKAAFYKLKAINERILEKTSLHDTIKNLADR